MIIITATKTEAIPLIEALNLVFVQKKPFTIYGSKDHHLIVSGIGKVRAAAALSYIVTKIQDPLLNIGYAAGKDVGKLYQISKVIDKERGSIYHLPKLEGFVHASLVTACEVATKKSRHLADMEGSALVEVARLYKRPITLLKITSDSFDPSKCPKDTRLINEHLDGILRLL